MDLVQIGRLSFTLVADAVSGENAGSSTSRDAEPKCAQLSSSTAMKDLLLAAQDVADTSVDAAASGGDGGLEVEFLRVVASTAATAATATAAAGRSSSTSQTSTPQSVGAANAPARSTKHRSVMRGSKSSTSSTGSYHAKQTLEKLDERSHKQQEQRHIEDTATRCCSSSAEDRSEEHTPADRAQIVSHDGDDAAADSDSSDVYESFRHYTRQPAAAHSEQSSPTASVARALFSRSTATAAAAGAHAAGTQSDAAAHHDAGSISADDSMQVDSGADHDDDASAHADTAAASDSSTASAAAPAVLVAVSADVVDLVSDSEEDGHSTTSCSYSGSSSSSSSTTAASAPVATVSVPAASGSSGSSSSSAFNSAPSKRSGKRKAQSRAAVGVAGLLEWCCKQCTLINAGSDNVCAACAGSKPSLTRGALVRSSSSPVCTDSMCTIAAAAAAAASTAAAAVDTAAGWACDFCDTLNAAAATRCTDCDYPPGVLSDGAQQRRNEPVCKSAEGSASMHVHNDDDMSIESGSSSSSSSKRHKLSQSLKTKKVSASSVKVSLRYCSLSLFELLLYAQ
jgi:trimeric autotransporter adhesin